jgi:hypothetical protein
MEVLTSGVYGIQLWAWPLIFIGIIIVFNWFSHEWRRRENIKKAGTKMLPQFCTSNGDTYWEWVEVNKDEFIKPELRGYDQKMKSLAQQSSGKFQSKNQGQQNFDWYFILPDHCFNIWWPFDAPKSEQLLVRTAHYVEGYPAPRVTADIEKWIPEEYGRVTSAIIAKSKDTSDMQAMMAEANNIFDKLLALEELPKDMKLVKLLCIASCGIGAIIGYLVFMMSGTVGKIAAQFGLSVADWIRLITG